MDNEDRKIYNAVLNFIQNNHGSYISEVAENLNLPIQKVSAVVDKLLNEGKIKNHKI